MLSRLKNKFKRSSPGGLSSTPDVSHVTSDDVTNLDESNQMTHTVALDTCVERRERKKGMPAMDEKKRWSEDFSRDSSLGGKRDSQESVIKGRRRDRFRRLYHMYLRPRGAIHDDGEPNRTSRRGSEPKRHSNFSSSDSDSDSSSESSTNEDLDQRFEIMQRESVSTRTSRVALSENWVCIQPQLTEEKESFTEEPEDVYGKEEQARTFVETEIEPEELQEPENVQPEEKVYDLQRKTEDKNHKTSQPPSAEGESSRNSTARLSSSSHATAGPYLPSQKTSTARSPNFVNLPSKKSSVPQSTVASNPPSQKTSSVQPPLVEEAPSAVEPSDVRSSVVADNSKRTSVTSDVWDNTVADMWNCTCNSRKLTSFIFVYNECTNRHWEWVKMPYEKKLEVDEPDWDENWQPTQPEIVTIIGKTVKSKRQNPKQKLHTVSRQFNFFENPLDEMDGSASESEKSLNEASAQDTPQLASKEVELPKSHHAMTRINGVPWKKNVLSGSYKKRRDISLLQVELMIAETDNYPGSDEVVLQTKRAKKKSSVAKRKSTVMPALLENVQAENTSENHDNESDVRPTVDGLGIRRGNVARLIQEFKNDSSKIENSLANKMNRDRPSLNREPKIECLAKTSLIFKGNGKFESIIMAGQTGAANEETLALGGPVEIVAKREFFVGVSLIYVFSVETLKEEKIELKSQGQKEVENLGMNRFGSDLVSRMIAQYTQMDERTGSRNQVPEILAEKKVEDDEMTRKVQETFRKRQKAELLKCIWTSRMRHFRDSLAEIVGAKFIPEKITAVIPEETSEDDLLSIKKYMRLELSACAGKNSTLPKNWPQSDTLEVVSSLIALSHSELEQIVLE